MTLRNLSRSAILPAVAALVVGCQVASPALAPPQDEATLKRSGSGRAAEPVARPAATVAVGGQTGAGTVGTTAPAPADAGSVATAPVAADLGVAGVTVAPATALDLSSFKAPPERAAEVRQALLAVKARALAAEPAQRVTATSGARIASADGRLTAVVPAGALSQDAEIKIVPLDPALFGDQGMYVPGILFATDLGGATLAPGTQIVVSMRLDAGFIEKVNAFDAGFEPGAYNLRQDADGNWLMEMPIKGPTLGAGPAPEAPLNPNLLEFGGLPGVAATTQVGGRALMAAEVDVDNQALVDAVRDAGAPGCSIPLWLVIHNESLGVWGCGAVNHGEICWGETSPPTETYVVKARWVSDDPDFNTKKAAGVAIHADYTFEQWWNIVARQGEKDLVTDANGQASTFTSLGSKVVLTASHAIASAQTSTVRANGPFTVTFDVPHNMPVITLKVTDSEIELPASLEVRYRLGGEERTESVSTASAAGKTSGDLTFKVKVPGEDFYAMTVLEVRSADRVLRQSPLVQPQTHEVRANGKATFTTQLISTAVK